MAVLTRRTWVQIQSETVKRLGNIDSVGTDGVTFPTRVGYWLYSGMLDLALTYHHFELDQSTVTVLSTAVNSLPLPADCYIVIAVRLKDVTGAIFKRQLTYKQFQSLADDYVAQVAQPQFYSRYGSNLYVDTLPDAAYRIEIFYYRLPVAPDFTNSASPDLGVDLDEHIMEGACRKAYPNLGRPDLGDVGRQLLSEFLAIQARPSVLDEPLPDFPERKQSARTMAGPQG